MSTGEAKHVSERVREAAAWVAGRARSVRIESERIEAYAAALPPPASHPPDPETELTMGDREARAAFVICLDAINFGSGWWPTIRKRPGRSGYFTVAAGLAQRFRCAGPWTATELRALDAAAIAAVLGQDPGHPLMADFAAALRDVAARVKADHGGSFAAVLDAAGGSAPALADLLASWDAFADVSIYEEREVPFFKRAQIAAADVARAGLAELRDLDRLTAFADNLVPQVLRVDGVLQLDPGLSARIDAGELLVHGSPEEVELRAAAVQAVELLVAARAAAGRPLIPAEIDAALWTRGGERRYKSRPRPRSRNTAY
ncbi:MAG: queuosine salvage family protein [Solirubrobacterales bacterium]